MKNRLATFTVRFAVPSEIDRKLESKEMTVEHYDAFNEALCEVLERVLRQQVDLIAAANETEGEVTT